MEQGLCEHPSVTVSLDIGRKWVAGCWAMAVFAAVGPDEERGALDSHAGMEGIWCDSVPAVAARVPTR